MGKNIAFIVQGMRASVNSRPVVLHATPFQVLVSTVLSARTRDENTARASKALFSRFPDAESLSKAPLKEVKKLIRMSGFYNVKARNIKKIASIVVKKHNGSVPQGTEELMSPAWRGKEDGCMHALLCLQFG